MIPAMPASAQAVPAAQQASSYRADLPRQKCRGLIGVPWERRTATRRRASDFPPPVSLPQASISPTYAAPQHNKTPSDQRVKPCWKTRPTLKLWRESPDSERKCPTIPPLRHQGFWPKARKYSGISKPTQGWEHVCVRGGGVGKGTEKTKLSDTYCSINSIL